MRDLTPEQLRLVRTLEQNAAAEAAWKRVKDWTMPASKEAIAEARRAIEDGNEDCIGLERMVPQPPICEAIAPARLYSEEHRCPYAAKFKTEDGKQLCQIHAEIWSVARTDK
jgi:hypothetical protein